MALYFAEQFAAIALSVEVMRLAPVNAASALVAAAGVGTAQADLVVPLLMTTFYVAVAALAVGTFARRAEAA